MAPRSRPTKKVKLTQAAAAAPVTRSRKKAVKKDLKPDDRTVAAPDLEIVFIKNEIVVKPPTTWQHRIAITETERAEKEKKLGEIKRAREVAEQRMAEVAARTKEIEEKEEAVRAKKTRQALLVSKLQRVFGAANVLGRLGDLYTYSDIKYRGAVEDACVSRRRSIVVTTPDVEASCRNYMVAEGYAEEHFRVISLNIWTPRDMSSLASETVKLADDVYKVVHDDAATQEVLWKLIRRMNSGFVFCKTDQEAADLSANSKYPGLCATITWDGVARNCVHRTGVPEKLPSVSEIATEEAKVEKLADEKARLKEELAKLKQQSDKTTLELEDAKKEVDRLDYMIVVKKDYCAANAASDVPLE